MRRPRARNFYRRNSSRSFPRGVRSTAMGVGNGNEILEPVIRSHGFCFFRRSFFRMNPGTFSLFPASCLIARSRRSISETSRAYSGNQTPSSSGADGLANVLVNAVDPALQSREISFDAVRRDARAVFIADVLFPRVVYLVVLRSPRAAFVTTVVLSVMIWALSCSISSRTGLQRFSRSRAPLYEANLAAGAVRAKTTVALSVVGETPLFGHAWRRAFSWFPPKRCGHVLRAGVGHRCTLRQFPRFHRASMTTAPGSSRTECGAP